MDGIDILDRFKIEFKDFDFLAKKQEDEVFFIRAIFYYLTITKNKDVSFYAVGKLVNRDKNTVRHGIYTSKLMIEQKNEYFMYFYNRALNCLNDIHTELSKDEIIKQKDFKIFSLEREIRRLKLKIKKND